MQSFRGVVDIKLWARNKNGSSAFEQNVSRVCYSSWKAYDVQ